MDEKIKATNADHIGERTNAEELPEFVAKRIDQLDHGSEITSRAAIGLLSCRLESQKCGSRARP
jgi:hypothetical protein